MDSPPSPEQIKAWRGGAPYTPNMENMGCQARWDLKRLRGRARATELGLVAVGKRPAPPHGHDAHWLQCRSMILKEELWLLRCHGHRRGQASAAARAAALPAGMSLGVTVRR